MYPTRAPERFLLGRLLRKGFSYPASIETADLRLGIVLNGALTPCRSRQIDIGVIGAGFARVEAFCKNRST